jgi:hypothetical protein
MKHLEGFDNKFRGNYNRQIFYKIGDCIEMDYTYQKISSIMDKRRYAKITDIQGEKVYLEFLTGEVFSMHVSKILKKIPTEKWEKLKLEFDMDKYNI